MFMIDVPKNEQSETKYVEYLKNTEPAEYVVIDKMEKGIQIKYYNNLSMPETIIDKLKNFIIKIFI